MGNCQAIDAAALVIQHPCGRIERLYWPVTASEIMRTNPGHYVSLIIPLPIFHHDSTTSNREENDDSKMVRFTRVKLLRSTDTLVLGRAYRLITSQEVMKVLRAKQQAKTQKKQRESMALDPKSLGCEEDVGKSELNDNSNAMKRERHRQKAGSTNVAAAAAAATRSKSWRPSLQSISEAGS